MGKEFMERKASDNEYLHKDFHGALSNGIDYLEKNYGKDAVREYLLQFSNSYYAPLKNEICTNGLVALKSYIERIYQVEGGKVNIAFSEDEMIVEIADCPAVSHMKAQGYHVACLFSETTRTVNEAICEDTPYAAELLEYDEETGRSVQRFVRRKQ